MANGQIVVNNGKLITLNRTFKATPDYGQPTQFKIGTGTNTPAVTDTNLQTPVNFDGGQLKAIVTGYPVLDEPNFQSTIRCLVLTTEANGNSLTEFGLFNSDGTPKMFSRAVYTAINKTLSIQLVYVEKDKIA